MTVFFIFALKFNDEIYKKIKIKEVIIYKKHKGRYDKNISYDRSYHLG